MKYCILFFFLGCMMINVNGQSTTNHDQQKQTTPSFPKSAPQANYTYKIIPSVNGTFGYDILMDGKPYIHQTSKPGLSGNEGFKSKELTAKIAEAVIVKIKNGEMPPSLTPKEIQAIEKKVKGNKNSNYKN